MSTTANKISSRAQELEGHVAEVASHALGEMKDSVCRIGTAISDVSHEVVHEAGKVAGDVYKKVKTQGEEKAEMVGNSIRNAPLISLGAAFLGGVIMGTLMRRS